MCLKAGKIAIILLRLNVMLMKRLGAFLVVLAVVAGGVLAQIPADSISDGLRHTPDSLVKRLEEVVVEQSVVRHGSVSDIYTITKQMRAGARDAGELLARINGIGYDYITKNVTYGGSRRVKILVDSVPKDDAYIKNLRHQRFDYVSVTPRPTGAYSDYDVVINFHTRRDYEGYEGSAQEEMHFMPGGRNGPGKDFSENNTETSATYTRNKFSLAVRADYEWQRTNISQEFVREFPLNGITERSLPVDFKNPNRHNFRSSGRIYASADYRFNKQNIISVFYQFRPTVNRLSANDEISQANSFIGAESRLFTENVTKSDGSGHNMGVYYVGQMKKWELNGSVTYNTNRTDSYYTDSRSSGFSLEDNRHNVTDYWWISADATRSIFNGKWQFRLGTQTCLIDATQKRLATGEVLSRLNNLRNRDGVNVSFTPSRKFNMSVDGGVSIYRNRYNTESRTDAYPYFQFSASWKISRNVTARVYYYNSTAASSLSDLIDYGQFSDSLVWRGGNHALKNHTMNNLRFNLQLFNSIYIQGGYSRENNAVFDIVQPGYGLRPDGIEGAYAMYKPENGRSYSYSIHMYGSREFGKHISLSMEGGVIYQKASYRNLSVSAVNPIETNMAVRYLSSDKTWGGEVRYHYGSNYTMTPQMKSREVDEYAYLALFKSFIGGKLTIVGAYTLPVHFYSGVTLNSRLTSAPLISRTYGDNLNRVNNKLIFQAQYRFWGGEKVRKINAQVQGIQ